MEEPKILQTQMSHWISFSDKMKLEIWPIKL